MQKIFEEFGGVIVNIIARFVHFVNSAQKIFLFLVHNAPNGCIFGNGIDGKPRGWLLLPQPPPRLFKNVGMPQLRSHFLYAFAENGAGQIGDVLIAVKTKQPQCLDFIVG